MWEKLIYKNHKRPTLNFTVIGTNMLHCKLVSDLTGERERYEFIKKWKASLLSVFRIRIRFLRIRIQVFFLNPDPDPVPDPGKEKTFRKAIQKNFGVPTSTVLIYLYIWIWTAEWLPIFHMYD